MTSSLGIDMVDVNRLADLLHERPGLEARLFTPEEIAYCRARSRPRAHLAGTLAAKEAAIKALRLGPLSAWARRIEVRRDADGVPTAIARTREGEIPLDVSISHDGGYAVAVAQALARSQHASPIPP